MKPKISIIGPSHRTHLWKPFYESIITNLDFEVIFVTDKRPEPHEVPGWELGYEISDDFVFHKNNGTFRYLFSKVKPAQCFEIAYYFSTGNFIIWTGDDFIYSPYALDNAYAMYKSFHDHKVMISFDVYEDGHEATRSYHKVPWDEKVQLTTSALISKQAIEEVGGLADKYFVCGHWDVDLQMRIYANNGRMFICPNAFAYEPHNAFHKNEANFATTWETELNYWTSLWQKDGKTTFQRQNIFTPYDHNHPNFLTENQGPAGKWTHI